MTQSDGLDQPSLEVVGSAALDRFIETFNSRDARAWAASLSYPHVRVSPRQHTGASATEGDYAEAVSYEAAHDMGWDHSAWDSKQILAVSPAKIHASAQWCRYDAAGERILTNDVSYVITRVSGRWGVQARFGVDSPPPDDASAAAGTARGALTRLLEALAAGAAGDVDPVVRFPFHVVGTGEVHSAASPDELLAHLGEAGATTGDITPLQVGRRGVNLGVALTRAGSHRLHGLFLVSLHDATPRVAAASLLPDPAVRDSGRPS